jgi:hypothetical protein
MFFTPFLPLATKVVSSGGFLGGLFGGKSEDRSSTGFNNALGSRGSLPYYPTQDDLTRASQNGGWEGHLQNAVTRGYNPSDGSINWAGNDWKGVVIGLNPISVKWYKGAGESFVTNSSIAATKPPVSFGFGSGGDTSSQPSQQTPDSNPLMGIIKNPIVWIVAALAGYKFLKK